MSGSSARVAGFVTYLSSALVFGCSATPRQPWERRTEEIISTRLASSTENGAPAEKKDSGEVEKDTAPQAAEKKDTGTHHHSFHLSAKDDAAASAKDEPTSKPA